MLNLENYKDISSYVYLLDPKDENYDSRIIEGKFLRGGKIDYQILKTSDNTSNGMQAMAVAPIKNGKADTSEIVIAYTGKSFSDKLDLHTDTDFQTIVLRKKCYS